eukprot:364703-Chlamydomonas_euryale.AAC.11
MPAQASCTRCQLKPRAHDASWPWGPASTMTCRKALQPSGALARPGGLGRQIAGARSGCTQEAQAHTVRQAAPRRRLAASSGARPQRLAMRRSHARARRVGNFGRSRCKGGYDGGLALLASY